MDNKKIGDFIADCRKEKQITQQQLADTLNITNKAVSKWETGNGLPDITLLAELAGILDVSVDEILNAEKKKISNVTTNDSAKKNPDKVISDQNTSPVIDYLVHKSIDKFKMMAVVSIFLSLLGLVIQYFIWKETGNLTGWLFGCWLEICGGAVFYYFERLMKNQIKNYNSLTAEYLNAKEISKRYIRSLRILWIIMILTLLFYLI